MKVFGPVVQTVSLPPPPLPPEPSSCPSTPSSALSTSSCHLLKVRARLATTLIAAHHVAAALIAAHVVPAGELAPAVLASINVSGHIVDFFCVHFGNDV